MSYLKYSEKEWLFLSASLLYSIVFIPLWSHSLVLAPLLLWYLYLFKMSWIKGFIWLGSTIAFYHFWEFISLIIVEKLGLASFLSNSSTLIQESLTKLVESNYSGETSSFVNYLLFNKSTDELSPFLTQLNHLSVTHLLVVSGMHMNMLKKMIEKFSSFISSKKWSKSLMFMVLGAYSWATAFSVPSCSVFLEEAGDLIASDKKTTPLIKWAKASWLSFILFPSSVSSLGFFLSYSISLLFSLIDKLELLKLKSWMLKISIAFLISVFTFSYKTSKLFPLAIINQMFLTPMITLMFMFFLVSWPFSFLSNMGANIYYFFKSFLSNLGLNSSYIESEGGSYLEPLYFSFMLSFLGLVVAQLYLSSESESQENEALSLNTKGV